MKIFWPNPPISPQGEQFHAMIGTKHLPKNEFCSTRKKLRFHATIGTKHLPKWVFKYSEENTFHITIETKHLPKMNFKYSEEITFSCNNWDKAFAKNEFWSTQKKLGERLLMQLLGHSICQKWVLKYTEEITFSPSYSLQLDECKGI